MANVLSIVSYKIFPAKLGGQKGIALFNQYFSEYHKLTCVTIKDNDPSLATYNMLNILSNSKLRYINIFYFFRLRSVIKRSEITHVVIEHPYYGWLGMLLKWACGIKLIVHSHNIESLRFKSTGKWWWKVLGWYEWVVHRFADFTFCITEEDRQYMIENFGVKAKNLAVITYGIEMEAPPTAMDKVLARIFIQKRFGIPTECALFLFNGTLDYLPNLEALKAILDKINPSFIKVGIPYRIIICGKNLPSELNDLKEYKDQNIVYAGFVDDVSIYFKGSDVFLNPVTDGGGIKTKLVEALGYNLNVVSTRNGAIGVSQDICNGKLVVCKDNDRQDFSHEMETALRFLERTIPSSYFKHFSWKNIARKAANSLPFQGGK